ncbi:hypothetical protein ALIPUT_01421 [Alistipes putredinis DSM 17216]|uniref:Uncharacterized protein n=1 Tax=Alistipes putredinis DSM 17216 TaxID=445970 RepID=B0MWB4_9BACT|nr:hypothetical protein ALIPUT_01421 [Alistipes putredinis DSM 17216]
MILPIIQCEFRAIYCARRTKLSGGGVRFRLSGCLIMRCLFPDILRYGPAPVGPPGIEARFYGPVFE